MTLNCFSCEKVSGWIQKLTGRIACKIDISALKVEGK